MSTNPALSTQEQDGDALHMRPQRLAEFIGQSALKENLTVFIQAAGLVRPRWPISLRGRWA